ncbi:MAG: 50S ribosomal protein L25 [bacterium]
MTSLKLTAQTRETTGKGNARSLRRQGLIPAILYGRGADVVSLTLSENEVSDLLATGQATTGVLNLEVVEGKKSTEKNVLIKEIQRHPYRDSIYHLDLLEVAMDQDISVMVPIETVGESIGITMGGILEYKRRELEVVCLPTNIPDSIIIDISDMDIGDTVHVESLQPPAGVSIPFDTNFTVLTLVGAAPEEIEEEEELDEELEEVAEGEEREPGEEPAEGEEEKEGEGG